MTRQRLEVSRYAHSPYESNTAAFPEPVSLRSPAGGPSGLFLDVVHMFAIIEADRSRFQRQWRATTRRYEYRLLDHDHTELLVYHWEPGDEFGGPNHPHVHVSATLNAQIDAVNERSIDLHGLHVATGRVSLETIVRMLIEEFAIAPRRHDWRETLDRTEAVFRQEATQRT